MSVETDIPGERLGPAATDEAVEQNGSGDDHSLLLDQLRQMHAETKSKDFKLDLEIPGFKGLVMARFKPYNLSKTERKADVLRKRMEAGDAILLDAACDTLVDACVGIFVRHTKEGEWIPLDDEEPITFEPRLGEALGFEAKTARGVVKQLFATEQAITGMAIAVNNWLQDVTKEVDEEYLGE